MIIVKRSEFVFYNWDCIWKSSVLALDNFNVCGFIVIVRRGIIPRFYY